MILCIFMIAHLLADFTFQPTILAETKKKKFNALLLHSFIYLLAFISAAAIFLDWNAAYPALIIIAGSHLLIDWGRKCIEEQLKNRSWIFIIFLIDQILHILIILMTVILLQLNECGNELYKSLLQDDLFKRIILYAMLFVFVLDPTAVFIKKLFEEITNENAYKVKESRNDLRVGNIIGKLERIITVVLVLCSQYGAVGLILTAKSIARFKQMEDKDFAEKYLVGTLTSLSIALISTMLVMFIEKKM